MAVKNSARKKQRGAFAPQEHGSDTSYRVGKPNYDKGSEKVAHVRVKGASRHGNVGGQSTQGVGLKRYEPHTEQQ